MNWCKIGLHKWKYVRKYYFGTFLGRKVELWYNIFRICERCGKVQELFVEGWSDLPEPKVQVLLSMIEDRGKYYELRTTTS